MPPEREQCFLSGLTSMSEKTKGLEQSGRTPIYEKQDLWVALAAALISGAVYFYTVQPNVGLLDSGEFITAAMHMGVPHPTGYPLWTIGAWLFQLVIPFGNAAWKVNLFSGFCGALAVGVTTVLASSFLRWMMPCWSKDGKAPQAVIVSSIALSFGLLFAFSYSVWTQAVIAEVYTLHCLMVALFVASLYWWVRRPEKDLPIFVAFFTFALGMSNHHLMLAMAFLLPVVPLLVRRSIFWEVVVACVVSAAMVYLGFAWLSKDATTWATAVRFAFFAALWTTVLFAVRWKDAGLAACGLLVFLGGVFFPKAGGAPVPPLWLVLVNVALFAGSIGLLVLLVRRALKRSDAKLLLLVPVAVFLGLAPYAYMPFASSTNPPMNWGYTRTPEGFFYSINRTQYQGSLSDLIVSKLGKAMGTVPPKPPEPVDPERISTLEMGREFATFYWAKVIENFSFFSIFFFFASALAIFRLPLRQRTFLYLLIFGFFLAAFLQPIMERTETTIDAWSLQFPYHGYAYLLFSLCCAAGAGYLVQLAASAKPGLRYAALLLPVLPLWKGVQNEPLCSQRGHWFGWDYGHDMLKDLPKDAFVFGGTDPGRFVPTYMILGESFVDPKYRRDPDFDRRDLVIVTQNALADAFYQRYIHDHYGVGRPAATTWLEKLLGRDKQYPKDTTALPSDQELVDIIRKVSLSLPPGANPQDPSIGILFHAAIAQWIFEHNKDRREFFIEESFPMDWTYQYAVPHGLCYRLNKEPLASLPPEEVAKDFEFWNAYVDRLVNDKNFQEDFDAKRSFSKLRNSTGNIYRARGMWAEAERAYRQALELHPNNLESLTALSEILRVQRRWDEMEKIWDTAIAGDPTNRIVQKARMRVTRLREAEREIATLKSAMLGQQPNPETLASLLRLYMEVGQPDAVRQELEQAAPSFAGSPDFYKFATEFCNAHGQWATGLPYARKNAEANPNNPEALLLLARFLFTNRQLQDFLPTAQKAVQLGGAQARAALEADPIYAMVRNTPEFKKLLGR